MEKGSESTILHQLKNEVASVRFALDVLQLEICSADEKSRLLLQADLALNHALQLWKTSRHLFEIKKYDH